MAPKTDLDLGHYERFLNIYTSQANNVTTGRIYQTVINKEREGAYRGQDGAGSAAYYRRDQAPHAAARPE
jgi:CTP synthase (UTP-ammonia lyase)